MFSYGFILVFQFEGGTYAEGACEKGAEEFGPKMEEVTRDWGRLHIDERHDLYCSPNIMRVIVSGRMR